MALAESDCLRSFGEATGFVENAVMDQAILGAQERMSVLLRSEIETAASNYARSDNVLNTTFPQGPAVKGSVTIKNVPGSARKLNVTLGVYAYPNSTYKMATSSVLFHDVPIY